jgi:hypothetical protein
MTGLTARSKNSLALFKALGREEGGIKFLFIPCNTGTPGGGGGGQRRSRRREEG